MHEEWKARSRAVWGTGDYSPASRQLEPAAVTLVESLEISGGMDVLDVAAGHGNCAIAAARQGANVLATDFSPHMIATGQERTQAAGLAIEWREADAADLPFDAASFDRVTSTFGAIFAPEQEQVAAEVIRVLRPGGRVGLTAWTPDSVIVEILMIGREYTPPPPADAPDPFRWGDPQQVAALFESQDCVVETRRRAVTFHYESWEQWSRDSNAHGMAVVMRDMMPPDAFQEMRARQQAATAEHNHADGDAVAFDAAYLEIIVRKPA
jgi:ubiquinone/menaquinone biosynthesis C-methylase UbiE